MKGKHPWSVPPPALLPRWLWLLQGLKWTFLREASDTYKESLRRSFGGNLGRGCESLRSTEVGSETPEPFLKISQNYSFTVRRSYSYTIHGLITSGIFIYFLFIYVWYFKWYTIIADTSGVSRFPYRKPKIYRINSHLWNYLSSTKIAPIAMLVLYT